MKLSLFIIPGLLLSMVSVANARSVQVERSVQKIVFTISTTALGVEFENAISNPDESVTFLNPQAIPDPSKNEKLFFYYSHHDDETPAGICSLVNMDYSGDMGLILHRGVGSQSTVVLKLNSNGSVRETTKGTSIISSVRCVPRS